MRTDNPMREIKIEKVVLSIGGTGEQLDKGTRLLGLLTGRKPSKRKSTRRIPSLGVRPGLEIGAMVTVRRNPEAILKRMLTAIDNKLRKKQIAENHFSFGLKEYIEVPGIEYQRDIGIMGFDVTVTFKRTGRRVGLRKIKNSKMSKKQNVSKGEIIKFMEDNFNTKFD